MTKTKQLANFPKLPIISDTDASAQMEEQNDCPWVQILFIAISATLWFSVGVFISISLLMPEMAFAAFVIISVAALTTSGTLYYFYLVNKAIHQEACRLPIRVDEEQPVLSFRHENTPCENSHEEFRGSNSDVVNLLGGLFSSARKPQLPPSTPQD